MGMLQDLVRGPINMASSFMNPNRGYEDAAKEIMTSWNQARGFLQPYNQAGTDQIPVLQGAENELLHPDEMINKWSEGYEMSPFATHLKDSAISSGMDSASQMGLLGSSAALNNVQAGAGKIMQSDRNNYLQDLIKQYLSGIGLGENIMNTGYGAGSNLSSGALQTGQNLGAANLGGANAPGELFGKMLGTAAGLYSDKLRGK